MTGVLDFIIHDRKKQPLKAELYINTYVDCYNSYCANNRRKSNSEQATDFFFLNFFVISIKFLLLQGYNK